MSYDAIVKGPEQSPQLGRVIRLNLVRHTGGSFDFACARCRGVPPVARTRTEWWRVEEVLSAAHAALTAHPGIECIVMSGSDEATLHPWFAVIVDGLLRIRAVRAPSMKLAILSDGSTLDRAEARRALSLVDVCLIKLDAGNDTTFRVINGGVLPLGRLVAGLRYPGNVDLLARLVRDAERTVDNTSPAAVDA